MNSSEVGQNRLSRTTEQTDGGLTGLDLSRVDRPAGQVVVVSLRGLRRDLSEVGRDQVQLDADGHVDVHPAWWDRASYLVIEVRTDDGLLGRAFQPTPDAV